jgi:hypothetical protein
LPSWARLERMVFANNSVLNNYLLTLNKRFMKKLSIPVSILFLFMIVSCGRKMQEAESSDSIETAETNASQVSNQLGNLPEHDLYSDGKTQLIKTVNYRFEVENVRKTTDAIELAVKKYPAYVSSSNIHLENPILENKITIRIQSDYFNDLLKEIDQQAVFVNFRDVKTDDVEKEFVDLESRIKTKREVEARYMEILRKKTGTIEELLRAEEQIGDLHEEIEASVSRVKYLKDQVRYSTITLEFYQTIVQEVKAENKPLFSEKLKEGLETGWQILVGILVALAYIWPLMVLGVVVYIVAKLRRKKKVFARI